MSEWKDRVERQRIRAAHLSCPAVISLQQGNGIFVRGCVKTGGAGEGLGEAVSMPLSASVLTSNITVELRRQQLKAN